MYVSSQKFNRSFYQALECIEAMEKPNTVNFIAIWGASATGKSTLASSLASAIKDSAVFSIDSYLNKDLKKDIFNHTSPNPDKPYIEGLDPAIWDLDAMNQDLLKLANSKSISMPIYNFSSQKRVACSKFYPKKLIFLEGAYALDNSVSDQIICSIILRANLHDRLMRKLVRTIRINERSDVDATIRRYLLQTNQSLGYYMHLYQQRADIILNNRLEPVSEFKIFYIKTHPGMAGYTKLIPKTKTGTLRPEEELRLYESHEKLVYMVNNNIIFSHRITYETYQLLCIYYEEHQV